MQQGDAPQFDIVFRRHHHLRFDVQGAERAFKFCARIGKDHFVVAVCFAGRLPGIAPDVARLQIADVAESAPVIAGGIAAPAGEGQVVPAAVTPAGVGHHQMVMAVGKQLHLWDQAVGSGENTRFVADRFNAPFVRLKVTARAVEIDRIRHAFL
ncbi:hypothetical protein D3C76_1141930 [compost metagenome]